MSFSFGFGGEGIDEDDTIDALKHQVQKASTKDPPTIANPRKWTFEKLLPTLPSQMTYNTIQISPEGVNRFQNVRIPRRSLFDIRAQLMAEANADENNHEKLLTGLDAGDLTSGQYEGGFKTWECAIDLAEQVTKLQLKGNWHVIELGAGSAIPSLTLLQNVLKGDHASQNIRFTLCDYNEDVLKLCTMPNVLLTCLVGPACRDKPSANNEDQDLDLEATSPNLSEDLEQQLKRSGVTVDFISGAWGPDFINLLQETHAERDSENILILASETIYSPATIKVFTSTVMDLLKRARSSARALVAAKKIYFGVGGGTDEFIRCVREAGGPIKVINENAGPDVGVGRVILEVTRPP